MMEWKSWAILVFVNLAYLGAVVGSLRMTSTWMGQGPDPDARRERLGRMVLQWGAAIFYGMCLTVTVVEVIERVCWR